MQRRRQRRALQDRPAAAPIEEGHVQRTLTPHVLHRAYAGKKRQGLAIAPEHHVLAVVHELTRRAIRERRCPPAKLRPRVQHEHARAGLRQRRRGREPREPASDDNDVGLDHEVDAARERNITRAHVSAAIAARRGRGILTTSENTS